MNKLIRWLLLAIFVVGSGVVPTKAQPCDETEFNAGTVFVLNETANWVGQVYVQVVNFNGKSGTVEITGDYAPGQAATTTGFNTGNAGQLPNGCYPNGWWGGFATAFATEHEGGISNGANGSIVYSLNALPIVAGTPAVFGVLILSDVQTNVPIDDASDGATETNATSPCGMPVWEVSEPYISLWLKDEPLGYQPGCGPRISFELAFKQRESVAGWNPGIFGVGPRWNFSWLSYVTQDANSNNIVYFPGGGQRTYFTTNDYLTRTSLSGDTTNGFTVLYPDGSQDVYGFVVTNASGEFLEAFLTARLNPQAQKTQLTYDNYVPTTPPRQPIIQLQYVIDGDGRINTIYYATNNPYNTNLISQVKDPFGRSCTLSYDTNGVLTNITDVGGISSSFLYDTNFNWVTNLTTPYGTTSFAITDTTGANIAPNGRSVQVTEPDGGTELYLYQDNEPGIAATYSTVPNTTPFTNTLDNADLNLRDSFHWGRLQYAALSTTNISAFTSNDFLKARMKHWLLTGSVATGQTISMERAPSPDSAGTIEGQKMWYDYAGKTNTEFEGSQCLPLLVGRVLPDGTTSFSRTDRNSIGNVLTNASTWSLGGTVAVRTNIFTYNATNGIDLITATNAMGVQVSSNLFNAYHETLIHYDALNEITSYIYNTNQQVVSVTLPTGLVITNIYGSDNFLARQIAIGFATNSFTHSNDLVSAYTDARGLSVGNTWDNLQRLAQVAYPDGTTVSYTYSNLDLVQVVDRMGYTNSFGYNNIREIVAATNALGFPTIYGYCACGALDSIQDALTNTTVFNYDNESRMTSVVYADGSSVTNAYNLIGQITNTTDGAGSSITNWYNNQGLPVAVSNAFGQVKAISYDTLDRATNIVDVNGVSVKMTYDNLGRMLTRSYPGGGTEYFGYSPAGMTAYTNQLGNATYYGFDAAGRKTAETNANNQVTQYACDGASDLISLTDAKTNKTQWGYDIYGRLTSKTNALGTTIMTYSYDADGRMTNRAMIGTTTGYTYDAVGNLKTIIYPQLTISNQYDAINELTNMTDGVGTTKFTYTATGQLQSETDLWTSNTVSNTVSYAYNQGHRTNLSLTQPSGLWSQTYGYDSAWRMTGITSPAGAFGYQYPSSINQYRIGGITLPNEASIINQYDNLSRLTNTALLNYWGHPLDGYEYGLDLLGLRTNITRQLGLTTNTVTVGYDGIDQLTTWSAREANGSLRHNEQLAYAYDAAGNLHTRTNDALVQTFNVDALNQIDNVTRTGPLTVTGATPVPATNVTINGVGAQTYGDFTFAGGSNTLANGANIFTIIAQNPYGVAATNSLTLNVYTNVTLQYDANGNLTNDGTRVFSYDAENQLTNVFETNASCVGFVYDGLNRRRITREYTWQTSAWVETNEIHYVCDGPLVIQEGDTNNNPKVTYTRGLDLSLSLQGAGGIGGLLARTDSNGSTFYHADGSGNITALIDAYQNIVARYRYDAFGKLLGRWGALADANHYRFSSMEFFSSPGIYAYPRRFYEPNFQRWLNQDPLGLGGGPNAYSFAGNDPIMFFDPYGEYTVWELLQITGGFVQGAGQGAQNVGNAAYNMVAGPSQLAGTLSTSYGEEQVANALASAALSGANFATDPCARQQDLTNLVNQLNALLNNPDELSQALANVGVLAATAGLGGFAAGAEEVDALAAAEETAPNLLYHYTTAPESSFANGLWEGTPVTDKLYTDAAQASQELGIPVPNKVIPIQNTGQFVPNTPAIVEPSPLRGWSGGGNDFINPQRVPPSQLFPAQPIGPR